jgi:hypothetical protein
MFVGTTLDTFVQKYMARDTKKKGTLRGGSLGITVGFIDALYR